MMTKVIHIDGPVTELGKVTGAAYLPSGAVAVAVELNGHTEALSVNALSLEHKQRVLALLDEKRP